jgi:hypothetical protein
LGFSESKAIITWLNNETGKYCILANRLCIAAKSFPTPIEHAFPKAIGIRVASLF